MKNKTICDKCGHITDGCNFWGKICVNCYNFIKSDYIPEYIKENIYKKEILQKRAIESIYRKYNKMEK